MKLLKRDRHDPDHGDTPVDRDGNPVHGDATRHPDRTGHPEDTTVLATDGPADPARDKFGGANLGACFFGWLVAVGMTVILIGLVAVVATVFGFSEDVTQSDAERRAGTVGIASGIVLLVTLMIAYYAGGYVAGRMSRFDGVRQGVTVWAIGLVVTVLAVVLGWLAGDRYNLLERVDLPSIPIPQDELTWGGVIAGVAILVGTLLAAMAGGQVGRRYHDRVDRAVVRG